MMITRKLNDDIKNVCPIHGVSIGTMDDRKTWRIDFTDEATASEKKAASAVLDAFDVAAPIVSDNIANELLDTESTAVLARKLEDLILKLDGDGVTVPGDAKKWAKGRHSKRRNALA